MSGAELANLLNEAALIAVGHRADRIGPADLDAARDRVLIGVKRTSLGAWLAQDPRAAQLVVGFEPHDVMAVARGPLTPDSAWRWPTWRPTSTARSPGKPSKPERRSQRGVGGDEAGQQVVLDVLGVGGSRSS
jgi:hypothetical protein